MGTLQPHIDQRKAAYNLHAMRSSLLNAITMMMPDLKLDYPMAYTNWAKYLAEFEVENSVQPLPDPATEEEKIFLGGRNIYNIYYNIG